jgi:hypothetical protein
MTMAKKETGIDGISIGGNEDGTDSFSPIGSGVGNRLGDTCGDRFGIAVPD